ncbi:MAG TPA: hypothetical protein VIX19_03245 [Terriglobales bacterium]
MTAADFRRMALKLREAVEGCHFGSVEFRVGGKIFTILALARQGYGVLLLTPNEQAGNGRRRGGDFHAGSGWLVG